MDEKKYTINIGDFTCGEETYSDRCLSASFGGIGVQTNVIPWEGTEYKPWDYRAEYETETIGEGQVQKVYTGKFVLDVIEIPVVLAPPTELE